MNPAKDVMALWQWPLTLMQTQAHFFESIMAMPVVLEARLPMIADSMRSPATANSAELSRMVTEKTAAFDHSRRSLTAVANKVQKANDANVRDLHKLSRGSMMWPADYMRIAERNLSVFAALIASPGEALAPIHKSVTANARRLRK